MTGVNNVETAVGKDHPLAPGAGVRDGHLQLFQGQGAALGALVLLHRPAQFRGADGGSAQLAHHDARGDIGQRHCLGQFRTRRHRGGQHGDHRVPGARDIVDLACHRRHVQFLLAGPQQGHAVFAAGYQQGLQVQLVHELLSLGHQLALGPAGADHRFQLVQVGGEQGGAPVAGEVAALGVHQHRHGAGPGDLDKGLRPRQRALGVVRQHQHLAAIQQLRQVRDESLHVGRCRRRLLEIQANKLLVPADYPQLGNGWATGHAGKGTLHPRARQHGLQGVRHLVIAAVAAQARAGTQRREVQGHVARAPRSVGNLFHLHHRHRCLGGDARRRALPVAIQHDVTQYQHTGAVEARQFEFHD